MPASVWPRATEIFQEGLRLRPTKLYRAGVLQEDVKNLIGDNCRIPETNWGDIKAMVAAVSSCDRRIQEMVRKFGLATVVEGIDAVLDYAEQRARAAIRKIPDGTYRFTEYMEDDLRSEVPIRLQVALTVEGDSIHLDFTGTDPQVGSALNIASHGVTHPFLCQAINAYLVTEDPGIPKASSILRPVRVTAPPGSVVNAQLPGADRRALRDRAPGVRRRPRRAGPGAARPRAGRAGGRDLAGGGLDPGSPDRPAAGPGRRADAGRRRRAARRWTASAAPTRRPGFLRNTPVESIEAEVPIVMRRYHLIPDTGGAGEHRGGLAVRLDFQVFHPHAIVTARGMERFRLEPWGVAGGRAGTSGSCVVNRGTPRARDIGKVDVLHLEPGDVVSIFSPSGGGHGDPRRRDPERVRDDVRAGCLSVEPGARGVRRGARGRARGRGGDRPAARGDAGAARRRVRLRRAPGRDGAPLAAGDPGRGRAGPRAACRRRCATGASTRSTTGSRRSRPSARPRRPTSRRPGPTSGRA